MAKSILSLNKSELQSLLHEVFGDQAPTLEPLSIPLVYPVDTHICWTQTGPAGRENEITVHLHMHKDEGRLTVIHGDDSIIFAAVRVYLKKGIYSLAYVGGVKDSVVLKCINDHIATWKKDSDNRRIEKLHYWMRQHIEQDETKTSESTWRKKVKPLFEYTISETSTGDFKIMLTDGKLMLYKEKGVGKWVDIHRYAFNDDDADDIYIPCLKRVGGHPSTGSYREQYEWCAKLATLLIFMEINRW